MDRQPPPSLLHHRASAAWRSRPRRSAAATSSGRDGASTVGSDIEDDASGSARSIPRRSARQGAKAAKARAGKALQQPDGRALQQPAEPCSNPMAKPCSNPKAECCTAGGGRVALPAAATWVVNCDHARPQVRSLRQVNQSGEGKDYSCGIGEPDLREACVGTRAWDACAGMRVCRLCADACVGTDRTHVGVAVHRD